ncbi:haloacid dehalogenase-like family hydrolase, putative [Theileria annulata]|uniref:Haloacid dehalogenase-like family hydrolase, putative n=1 Tax=Theileria annulata TaxID=5874 RepID=Q4UIR9_THEAN|nr:haloacid dehalogenase-like family hydrolase, putative [Theileria annulata]CAI73020.1 haloacid dehalogenase-like family hydrolase, putative [Theileria annulata]|eukprot:XP_953698.1 haloacid dehalogenase-like family hydrolase, putative [Theileria annulata]
MSILSIIIFILIYVSSVPISNFTKPTTLPKYFAIDIDGTFFINDQTKFQRNVEAFKKLKQKNVTAFFCTGRDTHCTKNLLGDSFFNDTGYTRFPGVYLNGAVVYDDKGEVIHMKTFSEEFLQAFYKFMDKESISDKVIFQGKDGCYCLGELYEDGKKFMESKKLSLPTNATKDTLNNIVGISLPFMPLVIENMKEGTDYNVKTAYNVITQITPPDSNKKIGLQKLLEHLGSNENECAFIGDDLNDIEPMEYCYLSFAVADAQNEVKNKAKWVLDKKHDECAFENVVKLLYDD